MSAITTRNGLRLASFDGGGIASISQLKMMQLLMHQVRCEADTDVQRKVMPCEYFDLIGGSDTGGLITIMFVKLRMSVEEAIEEFATIVNKVYQEGLHPEERTSRLRGCMESLLTRGGFPLDLKLNDESTRGRCIGFVSSTTRLNVRVKHCLRTYSVKSALPSDITVIDAALATCASQPEFLPLPFGAWFERQEYVGAGLEANNPVRQVLSEAHTYYRHQPITLLLSFGSGHPGILGPSNTDDSLYQLMRKMLQDNEQEAQAFQQDMAEATFYFRLSVEHAIERDPETYIGEISWIVAETLGYLSNPETKKKIHKCTNKLLQLTTVSAPETSRNPLKLVSFDAGSVLGFSQLKMMQRVMQRLKYFAPPDEQQKEILPCEYFDMIGGSDTGGLIAIMFAKLRMSVEEAIAEFAVIVHEVYAEGLRPGERTSRLRRCMGLLLTRKRLPLDLKLEDEVQDGSCVGFVVVALRRNVQSKVCLRTYSVEGEPPSGVTVVDAALATCALQPEFLPLPFGAWFERQEYVGAGLEANNPIRQVITEVQLYFTGEPTVSVLLSLGSGHPGILALDSGNNGSNLYQMIHEIMEDSERMAQEIRRQVVRTGFYFRFSVEQEPGRVENLPKDLNRVLEWISVRTSNYLDLPSTMGEFNECVNMIISGMGNPDDPVQLDSDRVSIQASLLSNCSTFFERC